MVDKKHSLARWREDAREARQRNATQPCRTSKKLTRPAASAPLGTRALGARSRLGISRHHWHHWRARASVVLGAPVEQGDLQRRPRSGVRTHGGAASLRSSSTISAIRSTASRGVRECARTSAAGGRGLLVALLHGVSGWGKKHEGAYPRMLASYRHEVSTELTIHLDKKKYEPGTV